MRVEKEASDADKKELDATAKVAGLGATRVPGSWLRIFGPRGFRACWEFF